MRKRRGIRAFETLFGDQITEEEKRKGRNQELLAERDMCICYRAYYYRVFHGVKVYEVMMEKLGREFFLSTDTVPRIVEAHAVESRRITNDAPTLEALRKMYPFFVWEVKESGE